MTDDHDHVRPDDGLDDDARRLDDVRPGTKVELDPTRVDVDPMLFGEFPDGHIEQQTVEHDVALVEDAQAHEWQREAFLAHYCEFCPECDGAVRIEPYASDGHEKATCRDCGEAWIWTVANCGDGS